MHHPYVVNVHDFGFSDSGIPYFTMDLVEGLYGGPCRLPMEELTDEEKRELEVVLKKVGII